MNNYQRARFAAALNRMAGDEELMEAMAELVVADTPAILSELKDQFDQNEPYEAASTAHKLKGMLSSFETGSPIPELQSVIDELRAGRLGEAQRIYQCCHGAIEELVAEIGELLVQVTD